MPDLRTDILTTREQLLARAPQWDDLWQRSTALPLAQAETVAGWLRCFAPQRAFRAVTVWQGGALLAALPLFGTLRQRLLPVGDLPGNHWSGAGELLLDKDAADDAVEALVEGLSRLPWPLLWLSGLDRDAPHWRRLCAALTRRGLDFASKDRFAVARVVAPRDWNAYFAERSKNHRRYVRRHERDLAAAGGATLELSERFTTEQLERTLNEVWAVEDSGWKGAAGTSIVRSAQARRFFRDQAGRLAEAGQLRLALLRHNRSGRAMACAYGFEARGVFGLSKIGFDPQFENLAPGQMLIGQLLQRLHETRPGTVVDFLGPLNEGLARWATHEYVVSRLAIAQRGLVGRTLLGAYRRLTSDTVANGSSTQAESE